MPDQIVRAFYYAAIHLIFASIVCLAALALTSIPRGSANTKYWIWVATSLNFFVPVGAILDRSWAAHLSWARPLATIGREIHDVLQLATVTALLGFLWLVGAALMSIRLYRRISAERRSTREERPGFVMQGVPVQFAAHADGPEMAGVLRPRISLPDGIERFLSEPEINAVLIHELTHARRRDNLTRLIYELGLCALWFHPLVWLAGSRLALYRELSCDERVIQSGHGANLVSALLKFADQGEALLRQAAASSFLSDRLARLAAAHPQQTPRAQNTLLAAAFAAVFLGGVFETIAHTACCFRIKG
jgi:beta-lactamase regulating signal transducer with metallopeptidase domain